LNNRVIKFLLIAILLPILITGCSSNAGQDDNVAKGNDINEEESIQEKISAYFPLFEGMHYEYRGEGIEYASFIRDIKHASQPLVQIHDNNGGTELATVYKVEEEMVSIISRQEEFYSDDNLLPGIDENTEPEEIILKAPLIKGTSWETNEKRMEIVEIGLELEVPAGKFFDVIKVKDYLIDRENEMVNYRYYAKNMGLIKRESIGDNFKVISELEAYQNKKADW